MTTRRFTVLLVDDHEGFLNAAVRHFRQTSWLDVVGCASNGLEALEKSDALKPDAVLMDLAMPEMGGLQACRLVKAQDCPPRVAIVSHFDDAQHRAHAEIAGADAFIGKSAYMQDALPLLERWAGRPEK